MKIAVLIPKYSHFALWTLALLLLFSGNVLAQKQLSLQKNKGGTLRFFEGDRLNVRVAENGRWYKGELEHVKTDTIILNGQKLGLSQIDAVRVYRPFLLGNGYILMTAGVLWPGIVAVNGLLANVTPLLTPGSIVGSVAMLGGGIALTQLGKRTYRIKKGHRLLITDFNLLPPALTDSLQLIPKP